MKLYFAPGACSLSPHIVLREAGKPVELVQVDLREKKIKENGDFFKINPKGQVPTLETDDGFVLTEQSGRDPRNSRIGMLHPARLVAVSLDRRTPIGGDMQLRQRAFHADGAGRQINSPYIGGHTSGEALATYHHTSTQQAHMVQSGKNLFWWDIWGIHYWAYSGP